MAIQITENKLSPKAKKALNNAKNKSQFLRDAIEYYVRRDEHIENSSVESLNMKKDLKEIKELLLNLSSSTINVESVVTKTDNLIVDNNNDIEVKRSNNEIPESSTDEFSDYDEIPECYDY